MQVGHNTLRLMAMGMEDRAAAAGELRHDAAPAGGSARCRRARAVVRPLHRARQLRRAPTRCTPWAACCKRHGARYSSHIRDEANHVFEAVREAIAVGEALRHPRADRAPEALRHGQLGRRRRLLAEIEAARSRGVRVDCDQYPYDAASNPLRNLLPTLGAGRRHGGDAGAARPSPMSARASAQTIAAQRPQQLRPHPVLGRRAHRHLAASAASTPAEPSARSRASAALRSARRGLRLIIADEGAPGSWSRRCRKPTCSAIAARRRASWSAPTAPRWRPTASPARASRIRASTARSRACSGTCVRDLGLLTLPQGDLQDDRRRRRRRSACADRGLLREG